MNERRMAAVWRETRFLAERIKEMETSGRMVLFCNELLIGDIRIDDVDRFIGIQEGNCTTVLFDGREDGFGYFETIKEARAYFAENFKVVTPINWMRTRLA